MSRVKICCPVDGVVNHFLAANEILEKNVIVYNENLLIHSRTHEEHLTTLDEVLSDNNMNIKLSK